MVRNHKLTFALLAGLMLMAWTAHATTLFTPPLVPDGDNQLDCDLLNVSGQTRSATIQVLTREGVVLESVDVTLHPGTEAVASVLADEQPRYCKFAVEGNKLHFRGSIVVRQPGVGSVSALSAE